MSCCAQALFGILQPVFGDADVQPRAVNPEIFQQRLRQIELHRTARSFQRGWTLVAPELIVPFVLINVATEIILSCPTACAA